MHNLRNRFVFTKISWSLSGFLSFLNPLRRRGSSEEPEENLSDDGVVYDEKETTDGSEFGASRPAEILSQRGHAMEAEQHRRQKQQEEPLSLFTPTRQSKNVASALTTSAHVAESDGPVSTPFKESAVSASPQLDMSSQSPAEKLEAVKQYLRDRADQPLHHVEYVGLVSLLKDSVQDDDSQPFRFSTSPTPSRCATPAFSLGSPTSSQQTPRRTLTRNPNGVYRWQGAGSARPRNRHQSPAFGPPRPTPSKFKLSVPESSPGKTDTKRRRIDTITESPAPHGIGESLPSAPPREESSAESSVLSSSSSSSFSSTSMTDSSPNKSTTVPATPRLRLSAPPKPTTPTVPSPLRNTWGTGDSSSPPHSSPSSKPIQPTRAANFMAELIKEVTPPKKPDLSNPYQTASPVKPSLQKKPGKRRKAAEARPKELEKKEVDLTPQTIIEATIPTGQFYTCIPDGSKRSRPPQNIGKAPAVKTNGPSRLEPPRRSARLKSPSPPRLNGIHAVTDEQGNEEPTGDGAPSSKRQKKAEDEKTPDVDMHSPTSPTNTPGDVPDAPESQPSAKKTMHATNGNFFNAATKPPFPLKSSAPKEPSKLRFGFAAETDSDSPPSAKPAFDTPARAPDQPPVPFTSKSEPKPSAIPSRPTLSAPSMAVPTSLHEAGSSAQLHLAKLAPSDPKQTALLLDPASLPLFSFNVPSGLRSSLKHAKERQAALTADSCSLPTFTFTFGAKLASVGFNWEAAGMRPPVKATGSWTCGVCMVNNDATEAKCVACEEPRPDSVIKGSTVMPAAASEHPKPAAPTGGFNWAAAGLKVPTKDPGTWTCNVCMVDNDATKIKCVSCEEPRPDSAPAPKAAAELPKPVVPSGVFNWAAAGLNVPTKAPGTWTCKVCMIDNDATKTKCVSCEEPRA
ncbi:hypothetical protein F5148DRAFT_1287252 [Russula earlei]|uniref:Uncharacterized protein n=1 Tax=Russula earlei TaxID=71964 RepID=A0ACC0U408_9AGAM|nr:hypothetical protein F5148DRAFT_1287252 [Russula earlei]